jgi:hypothetical protein
MGADGWPDEFHIIPPWVYGLLVAGLFALGGLAAFVTDWVTHRHRRIA